MTTEGTAMIVDHLSIGMVMLCSLTASCAGGGSHSDVGNEVTVVDGRSPVTAPRHQRAEASLGERPRITDPASPSIEQPEKRFLDKPLPVELQDDGGLIPLPTSSASRENEPLAR